jgi:hypothetical protein
MAATLEERSPTPFYTLPAKADLEKRAAPSSQSALDAT